MTRAKLVLLPLLSLLFASPACSDPIQEGRIEELGNEIEGIPKGPLHRAGQPCVVCHSEHGPANDSPFTVAGTIFAGPEVRIGVKDAEIRMTDSVGTKHIAHTNCVGNFFVKPSEWQPKFPILVAVAKRGAIRRMNSVIGREADCATCHTIKKDRDPTQQLIHVYLYGNDESGAEIDRQNCPVNPSLD